MGPKRNGTVFLIFVIASVLLRFYSFFPGVIDHDESTYLIIGRDLAGGKQLYGDVIDTKPAGIFLIYAFFHYIFGYSIFFSRLFVAVVVAFTAYMIHLASYKLFNERTSGFAAGLIYIFYTSVWTQYGLSPNTEQFFNLATIIGFFFLLKNKKWSYSLAGLCFGVGFIIKYLVLFDFVFLTAFFLVWELIQKKWKLKDIGFLKYLLAGIGFSLPFLLANLYFSLGENFDTFEYITYVLPFKYNKNPDNLKYIVLILDFIFRFLPLSFIFFYAIFSKGRILKKYQLWLFLCWIAGVLIAMYLPGKSFDHYTIQLMVPFSLVAGLFFHPGIKPDKYSGFVFGRKYGFLFLVIFVIIVQVSGITGIISEKDRPRKVAEYLRTNMSPDDTIYLSNYKHIVYYLLKKECPTKYVHPTLLTNPEHARALGIDAKKEIEKIMEIRPTFIVVKNPYPMMNELMGSDYSLLKTFFDGAVAVFRLKETSRGAPIN